MEKGSNAQLRPREAGGVAEDSAKPLKKAYRAPSLVRLGSLRELTLGKTSGLPEGGGTFIKPPM